MHQVAKSNRGQQHEQACGCPGEEHEDIDANNTQEPAHGIMLSTPEQGSANIRRNNFRRRSEPGTLCAASNTYPCDRSCKSYRRLCEKGIENPLIFCRRYFIRETNVFLIVSMPLSYGFRPTLQLERKRSLQQIVRPARMNCQAYRKTTSVPGSDSRRSSRTVRRLRLCLYSSRPPWRYFSWPVCHCIWARSSRAHRANRSALRKSGKPKEKPEHRRII